MGKLAVSSLKRQRLESVVEKESAPSCPAPEKLDPRVRRTRKLLEDALRELMSERHLDEITVADITERAAVNRATFYAHFEDKGHLASTMLSEDLHDALLKQLKPPVPFDQESLTRLTIGMFEFVGRLQARCPKHSDGFPPSIGETLQKTLENMFLTWMELDPKVARHFPGTDSGVVAGVFVWSIYGGAIRWGSLTHRPEAAAAAREIVAFLMQKTPVHAA